MKINIGDLVMCWPTQLYKKNYGEHQIILYLILDYNEKTKNFYVMVSNNVMDQTWVHNDFLKRSNWWNRKIYK
jgi:hypothetical protein